jgi:hypothetical protein
MAASAGEMAARAGEMAARTGESAASAGGMALVEHASGNRVDTEIGLEREMGSDPYPFSQTVHESPRHFAW